MARRAELVPLPGMDVPRPAGTHEQAVLDTLAAWAEQSHLTGPAHAATRAQLVSAAQAADHQSHLMTLGESTGFAVARTVLILSDLLGRAQPPAVAQDDPLLAFLPKRA